MPQTTGILGRITLNTLGNLNRSKLRNYSSSSSRLRNTKSIETNSPVRPWKDAASLILVAPSEKGPSAPPKFLTMKRSQGSSFAPGTLCFPGGQITGADGHKKWIVQFVKNIGWDYMKDVEFLEPSAVHPLAYGIKARGIQDPSTQFSEMIGHSIPNSVVFRIAAIRETFEECGILLCRRAVVQEVGKGLGKGSALGVGHVAKPTVIKDPNVIEKWQEKVKKDPSEFINLCDEFSCRPDLSALVEWSNWLTPNSFGTKRFDTIFYMVILPSTLPYLIDDHEVASARWSRASDVLEGASSGKTRLIPPQIYELTRLRNTNLNKINQLMRMRLQLGIERWCPCYIAATDGILSIFQGDDLYPADYKIEEFQDIRTLDSTIEELRKSTSSHHRIEIKSEYNFKLLCNISPRNGQIYID